MKVTLKAIARDVCPYCGGTDTDSDGRDSDFRRGITWYEMCCNTCGKYWNEVYQFQFTGCSLTDSNDVVFAPGCVGMELDVPDEED